MAATRQVKTSNAPEALGTYSQATSAGGLIYSSGQIGLDPKTMRLAVDVDKQIDRVFLNLKAIAEAALTDLDGAVQLTVYLVDLAHWPLINSAMAKYFCPPYPARTVVGVASLPLGAFVEAQAIFRVPHRRNAKPST